MKLKKLEITGFKSFADKSVIEFPNGISAIVGPNGCGKSNIVDALRWAMGEQSVKQLRGKAMEDVIFAGTNGRAPVNMAEVSIVLANDNGNAPDEFKDLSEIMLTRRLYRSGESGYFLNKRPCRLKDIHNIFLGSGMGAKSYAVIQQGNIGAITDAGPEERRIFIEEAAGITRYKVRKKETLRKIESTNQNLFRLKDIIVEVESQMTNLGRQVKKAQKFKELQQKIRDLDVRISVTQFAELTKKMASGSQLLAQLRDAEMAYCSELNHLEALVENLNLQKTQKSQIISSHKSQRFELQRKTDRMENDLSHAKQDVATLDEEIINLKQAQVELEKKNRAIQSDIQSVETDRGQLGSQISTLETELKQKEGELAQQRQALSVSRDQIDNLKANHIELAKKEAAYKNTVQNATENRDAIGRKIRMADEAEAMAKRDVAEKRQLVQRITSQLDDLRQESKDVEQELTEIRNRLESLHRSLDTYNREQQTLEVELSKVQSQYQTLQQMETNYDWYKEGVRSVMNFKAETANSGIIGPLGDVFEARPGFEIAVESIMGETLQYLLVEDQQSACQAIDHLKATGAGRCGFIPVDQFRNLLKNHDSGIVSKDISQFVSVTDGFEPVISKFLGHVTFVESLAEAMAQFNANGNGHTFVTKDGDYLQQDSVMVGGSGKKLSGILLKKTEMKRLGQTCAQLEDRLSSVRRQCSRITKDVEQTKKNLDKSMEAKDDIARETMETDKRLHSARQDLKHAEQNLIKAQAEKDRLLNDHDRLDAEISRCTSLLKQISGELAQKESEIQSMTERVQQLSSSLETGDGEIMEIKLKLTSFREKWQNYEKTLTRLKLFRDDGTTRLEQLRSDIAIKTNRHKIATEKIARYEKEIVVNYRKLTELEESIQELISQHDQVESQLKDHQNHISQIQKKLEQTKDQIRIVELEQSQNKILRENLAKQFSSRYNTSLADYSATVPPAKLDAADMDMDKLEHELANYRKRLAALGDVNTSAINEFEALDKRYQFLKSQQDDLMKAIEDLKKVIRKINRISQERFLNTFHQVNEKLGQVFPRLFEGGSARLELTEPDKPLESGVEFMVHPPGKKLTRLSLLSGGEKAMSAIAFIFSIFLIKPASFCILDEIDAPLDEANVMRFNELLKIIGQQSQIIMITHKKNSMEFADMLFGITMEKKGISKVVSVNLKKDHPELSMGAT